MADRLAALLEHFGIRARVFHTGTLCGINDVAADAAGFLHLVRRGPVRVMHGPTLAATVREPSLLLYPRPTPHRFETDPAQGADLACANLVFEGGAANPVAAALPPFTCLPLARLDGTGPVLDLLFAEAFAQNCGRVAMLDRLFEVVLIQVLRLSMQDGRADVGLLAGLADPRLRLALVAVHEAPSRDWTLEDMAACAGMSRSVFAQAFRERVGCTPALYVQRWRVGLAQRALAKGRPLKVVAIESGYGSEASFSRAFKRCAGVSPRGWLQAQRDAARSR